VDVFFQALQTPLKTIWLNNVANFLIWEKVVHWYYKEVLESSACFATRELKEVETLITTKYSTQIEDMQAQLFATTK
jgi:hypothetical protein